MKKLLLLLLLMSVGVASAQNLVGRWQRTGHSMSVEPYYRVIDDIDQSVYVYEFMHLGHLIVSWFNSPIHGNKDGHEFWEKKSYFVKGDFIYITHEDGSASKNPRYLEWISDNEFKLWSYSESKKKYDFWESYKKLN